ncbi:CRISPR-associated endonuclease Cas2 [uncultured Porphyromonas sp.]|uniref:CRISPR-associated endonuclease Cas2 n=1 Tax=uncultured Porphyromonas sp. TaxID=159274 RepID=UPI002610E404|nr:CRISPR-associated endonuclease Cas2 [uncultured Porphyromonas sp.]
MWILVAFDIPVLTKKQRREAAKFRKDLLGEGYIMLQFSVYIKPIPSIQHREPLISRLRKALPEEADVKVITITDKQYAEIIHLSGTKQKEPKLPKIRQLSLFEEF